MRTSADVSAGWPIACASIERDAHGLADVGPNASAGGDAGGSAAHAAGEFRHHPSREALERAARVRIGEIAPREGEHQIVTSAVLEKVSDLILHFIDGADDGDVSLAREVDVVGEAIRGNRAEVEP